MKTSGEGVDDDAWDVVKGMQVQFMVLQSIETHNVTLKNLALIRPKHGDSYITNQIARSVNNYC